MLDPDFLNYRLRYVSSVAFFKWLWPETEACPDIDTGTLQTWRTGIMEWDKLRSCQAPYPLLWNTWSVKSKDHSLFLRHSQCCQISSLSLFWQSHQGWLMLLPAWRNPRATKIDPNNKIAFVTLIPSWLRRPPNSDDPSCFPVMSIPHMNSQNQICRENPSGVWSKQSLSLKLAQLSAFTQAAFLPHPINLLLAARWMITVIFQKNFNCVAYIQQKIAKNEAPKHLCRYWSWWVFLMGTCWEGYPAACSTFEHFPGHMQWNLLHFSRQNKCLCFCTSVWGRDHTKLLLDARHDKLNGSCTLMLKGNISFRRNKLSTPFRISWICRTSCG